MLTELRISNFAVIDQLELNFCSGLHILTGETGAGKSIIVDAIALLIGGRGSADQIRSDADEAVLEAVFSLQAEGALAVRFRELDVLGVGETELIIRRVLSRTGRHRIYVNGALTPLHILQTLAGTLIDIHGQHEQQSLLSAQAQLDAVDAFGHLTDLRQEYAEQYGRWLAGRRELEETEWTAQDRRVRQDLLRFQCRELEEADLRSGEEEALIAERHRLTHTRRLAELQYDAYHALYDSDASVLAGLGIVSDRVRELAKIDPFADEWTRLSEEAAAQLQELAHQLRAYREGLDADPERLSHVEERLDRLQRLRKKYGASMDGLLARVHELKSQLEDLDAVDTRIIELRRIVDQEFRGVQDLGRTLSERRQAVARHLESRVETELAELRMDHTRFRIMVRSDEENVGPSGRDHVEFLLSANQGEALQPLTRVASGGELSRIMLAMKTVLADADAVSVLIFDEVDAGIGGAVAAVMGHRLRALSRFHQVFCITHLPQIASQASSHYRVQKTVVKKRTVTRVMKLDAQGRRNEIARMLGGLTITKSVQATAAEMIDEAEDHRSS